MHVYIVPRRERVQHENDKHRSHAHKTVGLV